MTDLTPEAEKELAALMREMANDKDMRPTVAKYLKEKKGRVLPDVEAAELESRVNARFEQDKQEREAEKVRERLEQQKNALRGRFDDAAIGEIEKVMEKYGISDYDAGAKIYAADLKPAAPSHEISDHRWQLPQIESKDFGNLKQISRQRAYQAIDDLKRKTA